MPSKRLASVRRCRKGAHWRTQAAAGLSVAHLAGEHGMSPGWRPFGRRSVFALHQGSALWYAAEVVSWRIADVIDF